MKTKLLPLMILVGLGTHTALFGWGCGGNGGCASVNPCQPVLCCGYATPCECTDLNAGRNPCIGLCEYCEAFGNIGAR